MSQSALSRLSGVPQPTINRILNGVGKKGPEASTVSRLAAACNVSFQWLHEGIGEKNRPSLPGFERVTIVTPGNADPEFVKIQKIKLRLAAGVSGYKAEQEQGGAAALSVPRTWVEKNGYSEDKLVAIKVSGESMQPGLFEGDIVIINTGDTTLVDGAVYAINYEGEPVVRRLSRDMGEWWLTCDNPDQQRFPRKLCRGGECLIVGRIIMKESERI